MTDQQGAEVEALVATVRTALEELRRAAAATLPATSDPMYDSAGQKSGDAEVALDALAQRIETLTAAEAMQAAEDKCETLTRERDEWKHEAESRGEWEQNGPAYLDRAEAAEAQRDRLAEALREIDAMVPDEERASPFQLKLKRVVRAALSPKEKSKPKPYRKPPYVDERRAW